jgi:hypothetical protein
MNFSILNVPVSYALFEKVSKRDTLRTVGMIELEELRGSPASGWTITEISQTSAYAVGDSRLGYWLRHCDNRSVGVVELWWRKSLFES